MNSIVSEKRYISEKLGVPYESLSQSYLRSKTTLTNQSKIDFILQANKKNGGVDEKLINLNDEFVITHYSVYLSVSEDSTDANLVQAEDYTYVPNNAASRFNGNSTNAVAIYNSDLKFTVDRTEFVPQFPMRAFFRVPDVQASVTPSDADILSGYKNGLYGFFPSEPTLLNGRQTIDLSIDMGATVDMTPTSGVVKATFEARGYLITNAAN